MSELFLGAMTFGERSGVAPRARNAPAFWTHADAGGDVIDSAINYRSGASEEITGELLHGRQDRFVLSTKCTVTRDRDDPNAAGNHRRTCGSRWKPACGGCAPTSRVSRSPVIGKACLRRLAASAPGSASAVPAASRRRVRFLTDPNEQPSGQGRG